MARVAITLSDSADGLVDIQVFIDGAKEGKAPTPASVLAMAMLQSAKEELALAFTDTSNPH